MSLLSTELASYIAKAISKTTISSFSISNHLPLSGGDIHSSYKIDDRRTSKSFFIKLNHAKYNDLLKSEAESLRVISKTKAIITPSIIVQGQFENTAFLVLDYIDMRSSGDEYQLGQHLTQLHRNTNKYYGFDHNNFIGTSPQSNTPTASWSEFWIEHRLKPQLEFAYKDGFKNKLKPLEYDLINATLLLLKDHQPEASLVHGDLWSGNKGFTTGGCPLIFDPAAYYGDREVDIAMTELFGGFTAAFYDGYHQAWPLDDDYHQRKIIYNLYHQLNHLHLFGSTYLNSCLQSIAKIIG
jgi:fructosamine-3-kinase